MLRTDVDEVDVETVDLGDELRERVQVRLDRAPVVVGHPVARERLDHGQRDALGLISDGLLLGPVRGRDASTKVVKSLFWNVDVEGPDLGDGLDGAHGGLLGWGRSARLHAAAQSGLVGPSRARSPLASPCLDERRLDPPDEVKRGALKESRGRNRPPRTMLRSGPAQENSGAALTADARPPRRQPRRRWTQAPAGRGRRRYDSSRGGAARRPRWWARALGDDPARSSRGAARGPEPLPGRPRDDRALARESRARARPVRHLEGCDAAALRVHTAE